MKECEFYKSILHLAKTNLRDITVADDAGAQQQKIK